MEDKEVFLDRYTNTLEVGDLVHNEALDPYQEHKYWYEIIELYSVYGKQLATIRKSGNGDPHTVPTQHLVWLKTPRKPLN
jgi:hypothetical protein